MDLRFKTAILAMGLALAGNANADIVSMGSYDALQFGDGTTITIAPGSANNSSIIVTNDALYPGFNGTYDALSNSNTPYSSSWYLNNQSQGEYNRIYNAYLSNQMVYILMATDVNGLFLLRDTNLDYDSIQGTFPNNEYLHMPSPISSVPVPPAVWLFGSALAGFVGFNRRNSA